MQKQAQSDPQGGAFCWWTPASVILMALVCSPLALAHGNHKHKALSIEIPKEVPKAKPPEKQDHPKQKKTGRQTGDALKDPLEVGVKNLYRDFNEKALWELSPKQQEKLYKKAAAKIRDDREIGTTDLTLALELKINDKFELDQQVREMSKRYDEVKESPLYKASLAERIDVVLHLYEDIAEKVPFIPQLKERRRKRQAQLIAIDAQNAHSSCEGMKIEYTTRPEKLLKRILEATRKAQPKELKHVTGCRLLVGHAPGGKELYVETDLVLRTVMQDIRTQEWRKPASEKHGELAIASASRPNVSLILREDKKGWYWAGYIRK